MRYLLMPLAMLAVFGCEPEVVSSPDLRQAPGCDAGCTASRCVLTDMGEMCIVAVGGTIEGVRYA